MSQKRYIVRKTIDCVLTRRKVTIATEMIDVYATGSGIPIQSVSGHKRCENVNLHLCPNGCVFISGGTGLGLDPRTGRQVTTQDLDI